MPTACHPPTREAEQRRRQVQPWSNLAHTKPLQQLPSSRPDSSSADFCVVRVAAECSSSGGRGKGKFCSHSPARLLPWGGGMQTEGKQRRALRVVVVRVCGKIAKKPNHLAKFGCGSGNILKYFFQKIGFHFSKICQNYKKKIRVTKKLKNYSLVPIFWYMFCGTNNFFKKLFKKIIF